MNLILFEKRCDRYHIPPNDHRARHIVGVLRARSGDTLRVGVIGGTVTHAVVDSVDPKQGVVLTADWSSATESARRREVTLLLGHPRPPVLKRLWRDLSALGVARIVVFGAQLSERSYLQSSVWRSVEEAVREGLSQGCHTDPPSIVRYHSLRAALQEVTSDARVYGGIGDQHWGFSRYMRELSTFQGNEPVTVCVGPERGFTDFEENLLQSASFQAVSLGSSILRTETAAILLVGSTLAVE